MDTDTRFPLWASNLLVFGILFVVVVLYFLWQLNQAKTAFFEHANDHAQLVAKVIQLNAQGALLSQQVTEDILQTFLGNTARFVDFLDSVEPFNQEELTAFAGETNLAGIRIYRQDDRVVEGPQGWFADTSFRCDQDRALHHHTAEHLYLLSWPRENTPGCILVGIPATRIEALQKQLGLNEITETLSNLPGICYARIEPSAPDARPVASPEVHMQNNLSSGVAEFRLLTAGNEIAVGLCTEYLTLTLSRIRRYFFIFGTALGCLGALLSLLLYRQQSSHMNQVRTYERHIAHERQDAALGRAAASIAHEIRNPLNAIKMGLQRIQIEGGVASTDHQNLLNLMLNEVRRTNEIVSGLLNFARPQTPKKEPVRIDLLIKNILEIYRAHCAEQAITVTQDISQHAPLAGDHDMLHQALENLFKNAIEAQPGGGFIHIELKRKGHEACLRMQNGGFSLPPDDADRILEPYFTSKADGTGLGITIAQRIIQAHGGHISVQSNRQGIVDVLLCLPLSV